MVWWVGGSKTIEEAIQQIERNSDRAIGIIAAAMLEEHITNAIKRRWHESPAMVRRMLQVDGPLGNFGPKIDLVFLMGLISADGHHDMILIKKIRNKFAHYLDVDTFETPVIKGWCFDLKHFQNFVYTDTEISGPGRPKKIFGSAGMDARLQTAKGRYLVAIQVYSMIFGPDWPGAYLPPISLPAPLY
jgi:DNA-binding MltR family transcriptional regulator